MKRSLALLLALVMVLSLCACGSKDDNDAKTTPGIDLGDTTKLSATPTLDPEQAGNHEVEVTTVKNADLDYSATDAIIPEETVTLEVFSQLANDVGLNGGWWGKIMLDKFNVQFNVVKDGDGVFSTRMEARNLGDIVIFGNTGDDYLDAIAAGLLFDWEEEDIFKTYAPYMYALSTTSFKNAIYKNRTLNDEGILYGMGMSVSAGGDHQAFMYWPCLRYDLYAQLGYPKIANLEGYVDVLKQMQEICPTDDKGNPTYGASLHKDWDGTMVMYVKSTAALYGWEELALGLYDVNNDTYQGCLEEDGMYIRCLKFYNKLYQAGLLDPDSSTNTWDNISENMTNGSTFFDIFNYVGEYYNSDTHTAEGKIMAPVAADDFKNLVNGLNSFGSNYVWTIGANTDYPELCMAIINYMYTPEGCMTYNYGPQGVCWDYNAEGYPYLTETGLQCQLDRDNAQVGGGYTGTFDEGICFFNATSWDVDAINPEAEGNQTYNYKNWVTYLDTTTSVALQNYKDHYEVDGFLDYVDTYVDFTVAPGTTYSEPKKSKELKATWTTVTDTIVNYTWKAVYAKTDAECDELIAEMIRLANEYGYEECLAWSEEQAAIRKELVAQVRD